MCISCSKTQSNSSQVSRELSDKGQSNEHRFLPISAFRLGCRSRLRMNFSEAVPRFSHQRWYRYNIVIRWANRWGGLRFVVKIVQVSYYWVQNSVLPGWCFHDLLKMKMPFKQCDMEAVKIAGYNKRTVRVNRFSHCQRVKKCSHMLISAPGGWCNTANIRQENPLGRRAGLRWTHWISCSLA